MVLVVFRGIIVKNKFFIPPKNHKGRRLSIGQNHITKSIQIRGVKVDIHRHQQIVPIRYHRLIRHGIIGVAMTNFDLIEDLGLDDLITNIPSPQIIQFIGILVLAPNGMCSQIDLPWSFRLKANRYFFHGLRSLIFFSCSFDAGIVGIGTPASWKALVRLLFAE